MPISLEDNFEDILKKAATGLRVGKNELALHAGLERYQLDNLMRGQLDDQSLLKCAERLSLNPKACLRIALGEYQPAELSVPGLVQLNLPYDHPVIGRMWVNCYIVYSERSRKAALFDCGPDVDAIVEIIEQHDLKLDNIYLTHNHRDHVAGLTALRQKIGKRTIHLNENENRPDTKSFSEGKSFGIGRLQVETLLTSGHTPGGTTFVINGLEKPVAIVGDSILAGSICGAPDSYQEALDNIRKKILTLPPETILCPGHGPMTTVAEEWANNPFFA